MKKFFSLLILMGFVLSPILAYADETITWATTDNDTISFGDNSAGKVMRAQKFTVSSDEDSGFLTAYLIIDTGSPADNAVITIQTDNAGHPSGTILGTWTKPAGELSGSCAQYISDEYTGLGLTSGQSYWIVFSRSGAADSSNFYRYCQNSGSNISDRYYSLNTGSTWSSGNGIYGDLHGSIE